MEERPTEYREDEIDLGIYFAILRKVWWKVALLSLAVGVATLLYMFTKPNIYQLSGSHTLGSGSEDEEEIMKCHVCGGEMRPIVTDLPFKVSRKTIVILKELPVLQCERCSEYMLEDRVLERVDVMIANVDEKVELKILEFAA
jgi:YgiT-type zinc finger domain-containing protein